MRPKSLGVSTMPRPKWDCQTRLTIDRQVRTFFGSLTQCASAARRAPSAFGSARRKRASNPRCVYARQRPRFGLALRLAHVAALQNENRARRQSRLREVPLLSGLKSWAAA